MKKFLLILAVLFLLVIALLVGGFFYANHYVQSAAFRDKLVAEISKATGGTVQIDAISVSLFQQVEFGGIKLSREDKQIGSRSYSTSTKKIEISFNYWALLHKQIEITGLYLDSPDIKVVSNPAATPSLPPAGQAPSAPAAPEQAPAGTPDISRPAETPPRPAEPPAPAAKMDLALVIRKAVVKNGRLDITLPNGKRALLEGFNLEAVFTEPMDVPHFKGNASCDTLTFTGLPPITQLKADYKFDKDVLLIEKAKANAARGTVEIDGQANISGNQPFKLRVTGSQLDLKQLLAGKPELASALDGEAYANVSLEGNFQAPLEATGKGTAEVKKGRITTKPIQFLMFTYQIPELQTIDLTKCETEFTIASHKMQFERIEARAEHLRLDGTGWYDFVDNTIDLNLHPALSEIAKNRLPGPVAIGFLQEPDGFYGISFRAWGPLDHPSHDIESKFAAGAWQNFLATEIPQNIVNSTFDTLEGMIKDKDSGSNTNSTSIIDSLFGGGSNTNAPPSEAAPPSDGSTNAAPEKKVEDFLKKLF